MNKLTRYIQSYLIIGFPFVLTAMIWDNSIEGNRFVGIIQGLLSWQLMLWFSVLIVFLILLVIIPNARELTLRRLANIKERDEREEYITGKASRVTYISMLSILILLFFSSIFSVNVKKLSDNQTFHGKRWIASISLGFHLFDDRKRKSTEEGLILFDSKNMSLSKSSILLILIGWQLIMFNCVARKEQIKGIK